MSVKALILKYIARTVKKREFWFTVIVYPVFVGGYLYVKHNRYFYNMVTSTGVWYFVASYALALYVVFMVAYEVIEKNLKHKISGKKLKQKQENWK